MNILLIGSGGREHALAIKLKESAGTDKLFALQGNPGIWKIAEKVEIPVNDFSAITDFVQNNQVNLVVVGPEEPLMNGLADYLNAAGIPVFGPKKNAAILEGSKAFSKDLMKKYNIPTADYQIFRDCDTAVEYLDNCTYPIVIKASGLAAGKGVIISQNKANATKAVKEMMQDKIFGQAGDEVVIEEFLSGEEASVFALTDGNYYKLLAPAQDHKTVFDGNLGPNTGGMGTYAPAPVVGKEMLVQIGREIIEPTLAAMRRENRPFTGALFVGLMITKNGPKVIEYNCRFGDPETQVVLPLLDADLTELLYNAATGNFKCNEILPAKPIHAVCIILASGGYPGNYEKKLPISGLENINEACLIHAGTILEDNRILTNGGRVLGVVATGTTLEATIKKAYSEVAKISFSNVHYRKDIGKNGLKFYS